MTTSKGLFSYTGNKFRIWSSNLKTILTPFERIHEPFLGSGVCLYNSARGGVGIDASNDVIEMHKCIFNPNFVSNCVDIANEYYPSGETTKDGFMRLRSDFNNTWKVSGTTQDNAPMLHVLVQSSFNSLLRFGPNGFNTPFGYKKLDFDRLADHVTLTETKEFSFFVGNYSSLNLSQIDKENDVIYLDPPYLASKYTYGGWNIENEVQLLEYIDRLDSLGYKFVLSNTFVHNGLTNSELIEWSKKYSVIDVSMRYFAWSAIVASAKTSKATREVIITNL